MSVPKKFNWERPETMRIEKTWYKFHARDKDSDELVEYRIQDLPESKFEDGLNFMAQHFCKDEPISEALGKKILEIIHKFCVPIILNLILKKDLASDVEAIDMYKGVWHQAFEQNMALACFKNGSNDIIGMNVNCVTSAQDIFEKEQTKQSVNEKMRKYGELIRLLYENVNLFDMYGVNECLKSFGLVVDEAYRGRGIAENFLKCRKDICKEFGIKVTATMFTSDASNKIADKVGFEVVKAMRYNDVFKTHPHLTMPIRSEKMALKSMLYE